MAGKAKEKLDAYNAHRARVDILARKLYETFISEDEYKLMTDRDKPAWRIDGLPWDKYPELELPEHGRDDYRAQAERLLEDTELKIEVNDSC